jgi:hypothetical protein
MVLPQQQDFYAYWQSKCEGGLIPSRADIDPCDFVEQLPMVTITERLDRPEGDCGNAPKDHAGQLNRRYRFRLAGTGFWRFYNSEIQGLHLDELPIGCRSDYWHRVLDLVVSQRRPFHGVTKPNTPVGSHMAQFWVRLPLSSDGVNIDSILGYDHICPLEEAVQVHGNAQKVYA